MDATICQSTRNPEASDATARKSGIPRRSVAAKLFRLLVIVSAFAAGWAVAKKSSHREKEALPPVDASAAGEDQSAVVVTVEPVTYRAVQRTVEGVGTLHGFEEVSICSKAAGRVRTLHCDVADRVKPGELLLEIDPTDAELAVQQAKHTLQVELAKLGLKEVPAAAVDFEKVPPVMEARTRMEKSKSHQERLAKLEATRAVSQEDLETARSEYQVAQEEYDNQLLLAETELATILMKQAALAVAQQQLIDTRILAPTPSLPVPGTTNGVRYAVTQRSVAEGSMLQPGTEVCKLVIDQTLKLRVPIPERYGADLHVGQKADVSTASFPHPVNGTVMRINPAVDVKTRTFEVEIQIPNSQGELKSGGFAKAAILTRLDPAAPTVPLSALVNYVGVDKIFLSENGRAKEVQVARGVQTSDWVEIAAPDLPRNAQIITSGQTALAADTSVCAREPLATEPDKSVARSLNPREPGKR